MFLTKENQSIVLQDASIAFLKLSQVWKDSKTQIENLGKIQEKNLEYLKDSNNQRWLNKLQCDQALVLHIKENMQKLTREKVEKITAYVEAGKKNTYIKNQFD